MESHEFSVSVNTSDDGSALVVFLEFPGMGQVTITFEKDGFDVQPVPVLQTNFDPSKIRIVDNAGHDRLVMTLKEQREYNNRLLD